MKDMGSKKNCRTFNVNEILGNFDRDWTGGIKDREYTLRKMNFRDKDGNLVNEKGYLIDEKTGDLRSRYSFDVVFKNAELVPIDKKSGRRVELPLPYRMEKFNFNPH